MSNYIPLHLHTFYSLLDGLNSPEEYVERAKELGMTHLSQTDHGTLSGHRDFYRACQSGGITPILGLEAYISQTDRFDKRGNTKRTDGTSVYNHITLLAENQSGLENLSRLSEIGWTEGYYHKPRIDTESLLEFGDGLIVLSGCLNGIIAKNIEQGNLEKADEFALVMKDRFGDKFFIEVQSHNPAEMNHALLDLADRLHIPPVMASDCHYANPEDLWAEEAMLILSTNPKQNKDIDRSKLNTMDMLEKLNYLYPDRKMTFQDIELYLRSHDDERDAFMRQGIDREDIFKNTLVVGDMVSDYTMPTNLDLLPKPKTDPDSRLRSLCNGGMSRRNCDTPVYRKRLETELEIVKKKNFASYFLIVSDMVNWSKRNDIFVGPGRGSAAGSLINYLIGITDVDPVQHNLLFARFINEERNDTPDVDVDIMDSRRHEVKEYLARKFKNVASISTFTYFKDKGVIRDASRVVAVPLGDVNKVLKTVETYEDFIHSQDTSWFRNKYPDVVKIANYLRGRIRSVGMHAAGVIVSSEPINKYAPIETRTDKDNSVSGRVPVVGYDMEEAEGMGLVKIDALGLKTLSVIYDCLNSIEDRHGKKIDLHAIDMEDPDVYRSLSNGFTKGVFQAEAAPYTSLLVKMGVENFDQLVASNALVRPGAMNTVGGDYIARKQGRQQPVKIHDIYDEITKETLGLCLPESQKVLSSRGRISIKDIVPGDIVLGEGGQHGIVQKAWKTGVKQVFEFTLDNGSKIRSTEDHRVLTSNGYVSIKDAYDNGNYVCINRSIQHGSVNSNDWEPVILAGLISEGSLGSHGTYSFANNDPDVLDEYERCGKMIFNITPKRYFNTRSNYISLSQTDRSIGGYHSKSEVRSYIASLGLEGTNSHNKFIPDVVFGWSAEARARFIGFYISCDGYVSSNVVKITTVSQQIAQDMHDLLGSLGIYSKIHTRNSGAFDVFILDFEKYNDMIKKFVYGKKRGVDVCGASRLAHAPESMKSLWRKSSLTQRDFSRVYGLSRSAINGSATTLSLWERVRGKSQYIYAKIISSEFVSTEDVYDIEVEDTHSFIASNIVVHNCLYQEQVMLLCNKLAGMSWSDADKIRKIIGKKKDVQEFEQYRSKFIDGATQHINSSIAEKLWHDFEAHSNYSFNKSHAVAYSTLSYWTAWLKHYYPHEFMYAVLKNEKDKDALTDYLIEAKRLRVPVFLPHVNSSSVNFNLTDKGITFGLANVKYISDTIAERIVNKAPFYNYEDLLDRTVREKGSGINSRAIDALNKIGGAQFDDNKLKGDEQDYFYEYLNIPKFNSDKITDKIKSNINNIVDFEEQGAFIFYGMVKAIKRGSGWSRIEIVDNTGSVGVFHNEGTQIVSGSMYLFLVCDNRIVRYIDLDELDNVGNDPFVRYLNVDSINIQHNQRVVLSFVSRKTKAGKLMAYVALSDKEKNITSALVFPRQYPQALGKMKPGAVVDVVLGKIDSGFMVKEIR